MRTTYVTETLHGTTKIYVSNNFCHDKFLFSSRSSGFYSNVACPNCLHSNIDSIQLFWPMNLIWVEEETQLQDHIRVDLMIS